MEPGRPMPYLHTRKHFVTRNVSFLGAAIIRPS
jgi:hypothetical protein